MVNGASSFATGAALGTGAVGSDFSDGLAIALVAVTGGCSQRNLGPFGALRSQYSAETSAAFFPLATTGEATVASTGEAATGAVGAEQGVGDADESSETSWSLWFRKLPSLSTTDAPAAFLR